jgi:cytochrome c oxidase assembly factor CtaG
VLAIALVSPLHALGSALFSAHMVQHELLMLVAAPLLVLARPLVAFARAVPPQWLLRAFTIGRRWMLPGRAWRMVTRPLCAWWIHATALWIWHAPALFEATLRSDLVHAAQHASFFLTALLFWWSLLRRRAGSADYGAAVLYLFTTSLHSGALGALLALSPGVWYRAYAASAPALGWEPLADQQLGGLLMWAPGGVAYAVAALVLARQVLSSIPVDPAGWRRAGAA